MCWQLTIYISSPIIALECSHFKITSKNLTIFAFISMMHSKILESLLKFNLSFHIVQ